MKRKRRNPAVTAIISLLTVFFIVGVLYSPAQAIPAFARKYGISCSTCHDPFPRLKAYGEEFAGNGFQLPDGDEPPRVFQNAGDDRLLLQRDLPLAFRFDGYYAVREDPGETANDFQTPWGLKILSGGNIAPDIGYYMYFYLSERGEVAGIEDAYVHFNNIAGTELDIMVGQFQISDPLFKRELRLTYEDYEFYKTHVGLSTADLTYDRGIFATYSLPSATDLALELVNGNGKGEAENRLFDNDKYKNVFFRVSQEVPLYSDPETEGSTMSLNVGGYSYFGTESYPGPGENKFYYYGYDATFGAERYEVSAQYNYRNDDNPMFNMISPGDIVVKSAICQAVWMPKDFWYVTALYNKIWANSIIYDALSLVPDYETLSCNLTYLQHTNVKMFAEYRYDIAFETNRFVLGFVTGF
ncbi:hypothetical protein ACFL6I_13275 [candidate division KSB1 bacterium]